MLPDYRYYKHTVRERLEVIFWGSVVILIVSWLFYRNLIMGLLLLPILLVFIKADKKRRIKERKRLLARQFRDGMQALASALQAGYSAENAFGQAERELIRIYGDDGMLVKEFALIQRQIRMNRPVEDALSCLAERSGLEDIAEMAQVFTIAKRSGGHLPEILRKAAQTLEDKGQLEEEIRTLMAAKRLEQRIMCLMPSAILAYVGLTSPEFLAPLYQGISGRLVMTVCLGVYGLAVWLGERIMKVKI